ncbi:lipoate--protein ligase family protein [Atopobacter phocae]|uniref:lipoate--protein ligase family protein n=1 Tax=Atopobacter phocae TaxID=136492 RepID=UPI00046FC93E|nr:hypothetical protein [Atopobacter phocae]
MIPPSFKIFNAYSKLQENILYPIVLDDLFLNMVNQEPTEGIIHFWPIQRMVLLGMTDTRLPHLNDALTVLKDADYPTVVRSAGGLGIVMDEGILSFSIILPNPSNMMSIEAGYEWLVSFINKWLATYDLNAQAFEIPTSYCPGTYDLSINGLKIAGLAQRRYKQGIGLMFYLSVNGPQRTRGELMRAFYDAGLKQEETPFHYPNIDPDSMTSLERILGQSLDMKRVQLEFAQTLQSYGLVDTIEFDQIPWSLASSYIEKMEKRQQII